MPDKVMPLGGEHFLRGGGGRPTPPRGKSGTVSLSRSTSLNALLHLSFRCEQLLATTSYLLEALGGTDAMDGRARGELKVDVRVWARKFDLRRDGKRASFSQSRTLPSKPP